MVFVIFPDYSHGFLQEEYNWSIPGKLWIKAMTSQVGWGNLT